MKRKKKTFTLLEIIIVIFLITLITGAIGYNMKGTLDRGRVFRTEQAQAELYDLLMLCASEGHKLEDICKRPKKHLEDLGLAKDPEKLLQDGWGQPFLITCENNDIVIRSTGLENYQKK